MKLFERLKDKARVRKHRELVNRAKKSFQLTELDGRLWLTHNGYYICPCQLFKYDAIDTIEAVREEYISTFEKIYLENCK